MNRNLVLTLTAIISLFCLYYLSFTYVARSYKADALSFATDKAGLVDKTKKQRYLDSLSKESVYLGSTLKEVFERELNLGLDLQGGLHVMLEVSPVEILKALSGRSQDAKFQEALAVAQKEQTNSQKSFVDLFYSSFKQVAPDQKLNTIFANSTNRNITSQSSDSDVLRFINEEVEGALSRSFEVIRKRVDKFGVTNPNVQRIPGTGRVQVELPGIDDPTRVRKLLTGAAKLEFCETYSIQEYAPALDGLGAIMAQDEAERKKTAAPSTTDTTKTTGLSSALTKAPTNKKDTTKLDQSSALTKLFIPTGNGLAVAVQDTARANALLTRQDVRALFPPDLNFAYDVKPTQLNNKEALALIAVKRGPNGEAPIGGEVITQAGQDYDQTGRVEVTMGMNAEGARKWRNLTAANVGRQVAVLLDGYVYSAPNVINEIPNGNTSITGNFTIEEGKDLANVLKAGKLPAPTRIVEDAYVGPSLGKEAISQGLVSSLAGLILVVIFMILYYGTSGNIANVALLFNLFFIVGILAMPGIGAVITLPGIAALVLTMGMAVDANVLINERIKEELKNGKGLMEAIALGYDKALSAIIDGNVTTFLIGLILYANGTGSVKGFAVTLMIGIICTIFTAVFISRVIIEAIAKRRLASGKTMSFDTFLSKNLFKNSTFDFIGKRKYSYWFSWGLIALGAIAFFVNGGFNLGLDFKGGRSFVVEFAQAIPADEVKAALADDFKNAAIEVKTFDTDNKLKITTTYLTSDESEAASATVRTALETGLQQFAANKPAIVGGSKVGATIADDLLSSSFVSIIYSILAIFIYILIRFRKWQYSLGGVVALVHDALVVLGMMCIVFLLGWELEVDQVFIAAVLTVIGYSINDTVVVFDRIREFLGVDPDLTDKKKVADTINASINQTLSRTTMTSLTTLIVVVVLLIFGGDILRSFSFALFIGVAFGTYSSIFVAAPIVVDLAAGKAPKLAEIPAATPATKKKK